MVNRERTVISRATKSKGLPFRSPKARANFVCPPPPMPEGRGLPASPKQHHYRISFRPVWVGSECSTCAEGKQTHSSSRSDRDIAEHLK